MNNILLLIDYRNQFWLKTDYKEQSVDVDLLTRELSGLGYSVIVKSFSQVDFSASDFKNWFVFYQSAQDPDLFYKSYIEDILLGLELQGAILLPAFPYFRSHHNKVFMEILREVRGSENMKLLKSKHFGTYEEYIGSSSLDRNKKYVFKLSAGDQSKNVALLDTKKKFRSVPETHSRSIDLYYWFIDQIKPYWKSRYPEYRKKSHHRRKFIIQEFIPGLSGDYKVLVFEGNEVYVLARETRPDDFRASGSGRFTYERNIPHELMDFSLEVFNSFSVPFISLDVAFSDNKYYLMEFQFVHFGTYTAEKSPFHFQKTTNGWEVIDEQIVIENVFAMSLDRFINRKYIKSV